MIFGNPNLFALEFEVTEAYERLSLRALGFFVVYVGGRCFGIKAEDATMLAIAFDGIGKRIAERGAHQASSISNADASALANAFSRSIYIDHDNRELFFGMLDSQFKNILYSKDIIWTPDGDEGFDDGSCVLQFDIGDMVRLVAFSRTTNPLYDPDSLQDIWLPQTDFYRILQNWYESFEQEWASRPKQFDGNQ